MKIFCCVSRCRLNLKFENFTSSFGKLRRKNTQKGVPHMQHDYFFLIQPIMVLICDFVLAVAVVISETP